MKTRTLDELSTNLRQELGWRRRENTVYQGLVETTSGEKQQAIMRGAVATLYAHWEGFAKSAFRAYFEYVKHRRLDHNELCLPLLSLIFRRRLKRVGGDQAIDSHREFTEWVLAEWPRRAQFPTPEDIISTSNLNSDVLKGFVRGLGLEYPDKFRTNEKTVIDSLVDARNHLAHGEWLKMEVKVYRQFYTGIDELLELVCDQVETAAATESYKRKPPQLV